MKVVFLFHVTYDVVCSFFIVLMQDHDVGIVAPPAELQKNVV